MAAIAARPPLVSAALLLGLTLLGGHEPAPREPARDAAASALVIQLQEPVLPSPPRPSRDVTPSTWMADMDDYPRGMVIHPPRTADRMDVWVAADWLSGFLSWLTSRAA